MNLNIYFRFFQLAILFSTCLHFISCDFDPNEKDYYRLLNVDRTADNREIRKAFKKLALTLHPDKNTNDSKAHENFLKLNRAYEVLKDEELRNIYNTQGEQGLKNKENGFNRGYQNWNYYYESFGIYDNDEEIFTLSWSDFEQSIRGVHAHEFIWFINFYSPQCSHCHHLAPEWRKMAKQLGAIVRIGAINCAEDRPLCQQEGIRSYPSLVLYPSKIKFDGQRTSESLVSFVLKNLNINEQQFDDSTLDWFLNSLKTSKSTPAEKYLIISCFDSVECLPDDTVKMLTYKVQNLLKVASFKCSAENANICKHFGIQKSQVSLFSDIANDPQNYVTIISENSNVEPVDLFQRIMQHFPSVLTMTAQQTKLLTKCLYSPESKTQHECIEKLSSGWVVVAFDFDNLLENSDINIELKMLAHLMPNNNVLKVACSSSSKEQATAELCKKLNIKKYPSVVTVKANIDFEYTSVEMYYGRLNAIDMLNFAYESFLSKLRTLTDGEFEKSVVKSTEPAVVQFFAPWCPACKTARQTLRKVSQHHFNTKLIFGVIDCGVYGTLCKQYNINSYPTVILYNSTVPHQYFGKYQEEDLLDFIENTLNSHAIELDPSSFTLLVDKRTDPSVVWAVDFYSPYCHPCQALAPIWRKLSNLLANEEPNSFKLGAVNCVKHKHFCGQLQVQSYPTIRLYPSKDDQKHGQSFYRFNEQRRDLYTLRAWLYDFLPSSVGEITSGNQFEELITSNKPTLVDFYAPWAFSSRKYAPDFIQLSKNLSEIKFVRINCQRFSSLCERASVEYFPTVRLYAQSVKTKSAFSWMGIHIQFPASNVDELSSEIRSFLPKSSNSVIKDEL